VTNRTGLAMAALLTMFTCGCLGWASNDVTPPGPTPTPGQARLDLAWSGMVIVAVLILSASAMAALSFGQWKLAGGGLVGGGVLGGLSLTLLYYQHWLALVMFVGMCVLAAGLCVYVVKNGKAIKQAMSESISFAEKLKAYTSDKDLDVVAEDTQCDTTRKLVAQERVKLGLKQGVQT